MKKILTITVLIVAALTISNTITAQSLKFGHINTNELFEIMPGRKQAADAFEKYAAQLEEQLGVMQSEGEKKYAEFVAAADSLSPLIRQTKEAEIQEISQRIQQFQQQAQQDLQQKEQELMKPIYDKMTNTIKEVAEEGGYIYVHNSSTLLYIGEKSIDLLPAVKAKLGL